jgi:cell division protease FtsH
MDKLHNMADALLKYETIDEDQISDIMAGALPRDKSGDDESSKPKAKVTGSSKPVQDS